ncbi:hypothetical protein MVES1_003990 [Malassezia vespertilionis]|uniref:uncharacterized protein n=1 Tax=Malassezia vespertilionis TaxID=2020962 RepID=UPI0024B1146C|nr:uncharacterized protein MVES1_003990 [Malassezia vespertilionis]WFD08614.1 hypothetical protein MVES1_003990 [Malassezia vespertilionis]
MTDRSEGTIHEPHMDVPEIHIARPPATYFPQVTVAQPGEPLEEARAQTAIPQLPTHAAPAGGEKMSVPHTPRVSHEQDFFDWDTDHNVDDAAKDDGKVQKTGFNYRKLTVHKFVMFLCGTFLGNLVVVGIMLIPILTVRYEYRKKHPNDRHADYIASNVEAWFIWAAVNLHLQWWGHFLLELLPATVLGLVRLFYGIPSKALQTFVEYYRAIVQYFKLIVYAAINWASWTIIFNSIYQLYSARMPKDNSWAPYTYRVYQVMEFIFFFVLTLCAEKIVIKFIAIRFHQSSYADRIQSTTHAFKVFDHLYIYRPKQYDAMAASAPAFQKIFAKRAEDTKNRFRDWRALFRRQAQNSSAAALRLAAIGMRDPAMLLKATQMGVKTELNTSAEAKRLARSLYVNYQRDRSRNYLVPSDFAPAYPDNPGGARNAFALFDRDGNGDVSQSEIKSTVMEVFKERRILGFAMQDLNNVVGGLDLIMCIIAGIFVLFEAFAIFNVNVAQTVSTFYSMGIAFAFVFKESAQNLFDSIIFIFVSHPYDTGDVVMLEDNVYVVKQLRLLSTRFTNTADNSDLYIANPILSQSSIINFRRSSHQYDETHIQVAFNTPLEKLNAVQDDLNDWIKNDPEHRFVYPTYIFVYAVNYMRYMDCTVGMTHSHNFQDWGAHLYRKVAFFAALSYFLRKHEVAFEYEVESAMAWDQDWEAEYLNKYTTASDDASDSDAVPVNLFEPPLPTKMATTASDVPQGTANNIDWPSSIHYIPPDTSFEHDTKLAGGRLAQHAPDESTATTYMYFRPPSERGDADEIRKRNYTAA